MKPKTASKKTVSKTCSDCDRQVPVASKTCSCGHTFYSKKGADSTNGSGTEDSSAPKSPPPPPNEKGTDPGSPCTPRSSCSSSIDISPGRRRTERVKRERPNYFNALEFISPTTTRRRRATSTNNSQSSEEPAKKKRGRPRGNLKYRDDSESSSSKSADREVDAFAGVPVEKVMQYAVILAEINRKYTLQTFRP